MIDFANIPMLPPAAIKVKPAPVSHATYQNAVRVFGAHWAAQHMRPPKINGNKISLLILDDDHPEEAA